MKFIFKPDAELDWSEKMVKYTFIAMVIFLIAVTR